MKKLLLILLLTSGFTFADEGMWMLNQIKQLELEKKGMEIKPEDLYSSGKTSLLDAIVWLGGCSASFVSEQGLVLTNHHCAYRALQRNASKSGIDYIKVGFLATDKEHELPAMGTNAYVIQNISDVSSKVLDEAANIEDLVERQKKIERTIARIEEELEAGKEDILVKIAAMFEGTEYWQFVYKKYQDVRIVYAPPASIGKYGGDIDNWMWPRHTGDFTYLRVYQGKDGSGAKFNEDNVPLTPKNHLRIASEPLREGDFSFIIGFPGKTTRWQTSYAVAWALDKYYKVRIKEFSEVIDIIDSFGNKERMAKFKLAGLRAGLANAMKNYQGNVDGMLKSDFVKQKQDYEAELMQFINQNPELQKKYGHIFKGIEKQYARTEKIYLQNTAALYFSRLSGTLTSVANAVWSAASERAKPEDEREPGFSERTVRQKAERVKYSYLSFYEPFDKVVLIRALKRAKSFKDCKAFNGLDFIDNIEEFVEHAYAQSKLKDPEFAKELYFKSIEELKEIDDPFFKLASAVYDAKQFLKKENDSIKADLSQLRSEYIQAVSTWKGQPIYPDANSTVRLTYGYIKGYSPQDAMWYKPFTTLSGVIAKNTGEEPFDMPEKLEELSAAQDFGKWKDEQLVDVPVAFLNTCDITGGNSGSAVMNAKGELTGLAFDGNYEALTCDWKFDNAIQRTIAVDIRYVLFVTEKFAGAEYLLKEMGL